MSDNVDYNIGATGNRIMVSVTLAEYRDLVSKKEQFIQCMHENADLKMELRAKEDELALLKSKEKHVS